MAEIRKPRKRKDTRTELMRTIRKLLLENRKLGEKMMAKK